MTASLVELEQPTCDSVGDFWSAIRFICTRSDLSRMEKLGVIEAIKHEILDGLQKDFDVSGIDRI